MPRQPVGAEDGAAGFPEIGIHSQPTKKRVTDMPRWMAGPCETAEQNDERASSRAPDFLEGLTRWFDENDLLCGTYKEGPRSGTASTNVGGVLQTWKTPVRARPPAFVNPDQHDASWHAADAPLDASRGPSTHQDAFDYKLRRRGSEPRVSEVVLSSSSTPSRAPNYISLVRLLTAIYTAVIARSLINRHSL